VRFGSVEVVIQDSRVRANRAQKKSASTKPVRIAIDRDELLERSSDGKDPGASSRAVNTNRELTGHPEVPQDEDFLR